MFTAPAARADTVPCPQFGGHRGASWPVPFTEGSVGAETAAMNDPSLAYVEDDVQATSDGYTIMNHDATWDRTSNTTGRVNAHTLAWTLAHVRLHDGSVPMTAPQYIHLMWLHHQHGWLHVKPGNNLTYVAAVLRVHYAPSLVRVLGDYTSLTALRKLAPKTYLFEDLVTGPDQLAQARTLGDRLMVGHVNAPLSPSWITPYIGSGMAVDTVANTPEQDASVVDWPFSRILTTDVKRTLTAYTAAGVCT